MVTSLRTPRPEMMSPQRITPEMEMLEDVFTRVAASWLPTPARLAASVAQAASSAVMANPKMVPRSAVEVRAENPWAKYSTPIMITVDPTKASSSGGFPSTRPGSRKFASTKYAPTSPIRARSPRHLATAMTTTA